MAPNSEQSEPIWRIRYLLYIELIYLSPWILAGVVHGVVRCVQPQRGGASVGSLPFFISELGAALLLTALVVFVLTRRYLATPGDIGLHGSHLRANVMWGILGALAMTLATTGVSTLQSLTVPWTPVAHPLVERAETALSNSDLVLTVVAALAGELADTFFLVGLVYVTLKRRLGSWPALLIYGVVVAAGHVHPVLMLPGLASALVLVAMFEWRGSLVTPLVAAPIALVIEILSRLG